VDAGADGAPAPGYAQLYVRGAAMHLTNPKAVVVWLSVVSLAFSTAPARRAYRAGERGIHALLAGVFGYAGLRMLLFTSINTR